jgi:hypothetical protein
VFPTFTDEIAFGSDPFDIAQTYTEVTASVESRSVRRGRQTEADTPTTGTGSFVLFDDDRSFDPENTASAHYPGVVPMRRMRSTAHLTGVDYQLFQTFIDIEGGWQRDESVPGVATVDVPGNDAFDIFAAAQLSAADSFPLQQAGERISAVADVVGWPAAMRDIDAGQEPVQALAAGSLDGASALSVMQDAERTEPGFLFIDYRGYLCFHDRHRRLVAPYTVSQATFCDGPNAAIGRLLYKSLVTRQSKIRNDIRITPAGIATVVEQDATSIGKYRQRTDPISTLHTTSLRAQDAASWRLNQEKDRYTRFEELTLELGDDTDLWVQALSRKIGDRITVIRTPNGGVAAESKDCHIENIALDVGPGATASCVWRLSPADQTTYWLAGVAGFSEGGVTTRGAY